MTRHLVTDSSFLTACLYVSTTTAPVSCVLLQFASYAFMSAKSGALSWPPIKWSMVYMVKQPYMPDTYWYLLSLHPGCVPQSAMPWPTRHEACSVSLSHKSKHLWSWYISNQSVPWIHWWYNYLKMAFHQKARLDCKLECLLEMQLVSRHLRHQSPWVANRILKCPLITSTLCRQTSCIGWQSLYLKAALCTIRSPFEFCFTSLQWGHKLWPARRIKNLQANLMAAIDWHSDLAKMSFAMTAHGLRHEVCLPTRSHSICPYCNHLIGCRYRHQRWSLLKDYWRKYTFNVIQE